MICHVIKQVYLYIIKLHKLDYEKKWVSALKSLNKFRPFPWFPSRRVQNQNCIIEWNNRKVPYTLPTCVPNCHLYSLPSYSEQLDFKIHTCKHKNKTHHMHQNGCINQSKYAQQYRKMLKLPTFQGPFSEIYKKFNSFFLNQTCINLRTD